MNLIIDNLHDGLDGMFLHVLKPESEEIDQRARREMSGKKM